VCLEKVPDPNTYQSLASHLLCILTQHTCHPLLARLILHQDSAGCQVQHLRQYQLIRHHHHISPVEMGLPSMAAIRQHNHLLTRHLFTVQHSQPRVYQEEQELLFRLVLESVANFQSSLIETRATSSARNNASSTSLKVVPNHGKNQAAKLNSPLQEQIAE
jgi:hypothetical protein